jgi:hypothetical protein
MSIIREDLQCILDMKLQVAGRPKNMVFAGNEELLLKHGIDFAPPTGLPKGLKYGPWRECFSNAAKLVLDNPTEYAYVEGFAYRIVMPMVHAWVIDRAGNAIDLTWREPAGDEYLGIPFKTSFLFKTMAATGVYGTLLENWAENFPLLTGKIPLEDAVLDLPTWVRDTR